jgi:hypothetical protein
MDSVLGFSLRSEKKSWFENKQNYYQTNLVLRVDKIILIWKKFNILQRLV